MDGLWAKNFMLNCIFLFFVFRLSSTARQFETPNLWKVLKETPLDVAEFIDLLEKTKIFTQLEDTQTYWTAFVPPSDKLKEARKKSPDENFLAMSHLFKSKRDSILYIANLDNDAFPKEPISITKYQGSEYGRGRFRVASRKYNGSFFIFQKINSDMTKSYSVDNAKFVKGKENNMALNGVFHVIDEVLTPFGQESQLMPYLNAQKTTYNEMLTLIAHYSKDPNAGQAVTQYIKESGVNFNTRTYLLTSSEVWKKLPNDQMIRVLNTSIGLTVLFNHMIPSEIALSSSLKMLTSFSIGQWLTPVYLDYSPPRRIFFQDRKGQNFVEVNSVVSKITLMDYHLQGAVINHIDWIPGFKYGYLQDVLQQATADFYAQCKKDTFCAGAIGTNSTPRYHTVFAPKVFHNSLSADAKVKVLKMHFVSKYQLTRRLLMSESTYYDTVDGVGRMRINFDAKNTEYIEVRPAATDEGYISAKIETSDKTTLSGVAQIITRPFGIYDFTILDFLKTRPDLFSNYLTYFKDLKYTLPSLATMFVPTNAAFTKMKMDQLNGMDILRKNRSRSWVLRRMIFPNVKLFLESKVIGWGKPFKSANSDFDLYNPTISVKGSPTSIGKKAGLLAIVGASVQVVLHRGGYGAKDGMVYPLDDVLYVNNDIDPACISKFCCGSLNSINPVKVMLFALIAFLLR